MTDFMWLDQYGEYHAPAQMTTHHLFYTIKMMWNHIVPHEYRLTPYKQYELNPVRFTQEYCKQAVQELSKELRIRHDYWHYFGQMEQLKQKMEAHKTRRIKCHHK